MPDSKFTLANFMRTLEFGRLTLRIGMDILFEKEHVRLDKPWPRGFFKTEVVGQRIMAAALNTPITVMETAGEGGYGAVGRIYA